MFRLFVGLGFCKGLILQTTEAGPFGDYLSLVQNPRIMALISGRALDTAEAETQYAAMQARNLLHPACGYFYLCDRNGRLMGLCKHGFAPQAEPVHENGCRRQLWLLPLFPTKNRAT